MCYLFLLYISFGLFGVLALEEGLITNGDNFMYIFVFIGTIFFCFCSLLRAK